MIIESLAQSRKKVVFDVTAAEFETALNEAFEICNKEVTIKGFRKGHAPRSFYEKQYGVESLYDEALNCVLNAKVKELYNDKDLVAQICSQFVPSVEGNDFERGKDFKVSLSFDVYPEVSLGQYKGIEIKKENTKVTEDDVTNSINSLLKSQIEVVVKQNQVIEKGNVAVFDFVGSVDGVEFPGGKAENYELNIGSGQFIPGFEEQMIGMKSGETKDINVTFPEQYQSEDLAGKAAVFKVTIHEVKEEKVPALTDELVVSLNAGANTVEELKANKQAELTTQKEAAEKDRQADAIINKVLDNAVVDMPQSLIDERVNQIRSQYEQQAKMYNIPFETFLGFMQTDLTKFTEQTLEQGKRQALFNLVISKIIETENLAPTKEELEARAQKDADATKKSVESLLAEKAQVYYSEMAYNKVIDFLIANAKIN